MKNNYLILFQPDLCLKKGMIVIMNWLIRLYNQNRKMLIVIIIIIIFIIILIQALNYLASRQLEQDNKETLNESMEIEEVYNKNESLLYGENAVSSDRAEQYNNTIDTFLNYCLNGDTGNAYNLLSTVCKDELYPSQQLFEEQYYNSIFGTNKIYSFQYWSGATYQVNISDDILKTGGQGEKTVDYYTLVNEGNDYKLNINGLIGRQASNVTVESNNLKITIQSIVQYNDYAVYNVNVKNDSDKIVLLDSQKSTSSIYAINENDVEFRAYNEDLYLNDLLVNPHTEKNLQITFSTRYSSTIQIKSIVLSDIVLDYESYRADPNNYDNTISVEIDL